MPEPSDAPAVADAQAAAPSPDTAQAAAAAPSQPAARGSGPDAPDTAENIASFREALRERGLGEDVLGDIDDEAALDVLVDNYRRVGQLEQLARYGQWALENWERIKPLIEGAGQAPDGGQAPQGDRQQAQGKGAQEKPYWDPGPEWDPRLEQFLEYDANGNLVARGVNDPTLPTRYLERKRWEREAIQRLLADPYAVVEPKVQEAIAAAVQQAVQQAQQWFGEQTRTQNDERFIQAFLQANEQLLYRCDSNGRPVVDPRNGQPILSEAGQQFYATIERLQRAGVKDPVIAADIALQTLGAGVRDGRQERPAPSSSTPSPQAPEAAARERFLSAEHRPPRTGSFPDQTQTTAQNTLDIPLAERMRQWIAEHGEPALPVP